MLPPETDAETVNELLELSQRLLTAIDDQDWETYCELCDAELTAFEPEAFEHLVSGLDFHRFYFTDAPPQKQRQSTISSPRINLLGDVAIITCTRLVQHRSDGATCNDRLCRDAHLASPRRPLETRPLSPIDRNRPHFMTSPSPQPGTLLVICGDILFASRITGTASQLGITAAVVADPSELTDPSAGANCRCVIVDVMHPAVDMAALRNAFPGDQRPTFIAFGPHVETDRLNAAREAGCDVVLPRSRFVAELAGLLQQHCAG